MGRTKGKKKKLYSIFEKEAVILMLPHWVAALSFLFSVANITCFMSMTAKFVENVFCPDHFFPLRNSYIMCCKVERKGWPIHQKGATQGIHGGGNIIALPFSGNLWTRKRGPYFNEIRHLLKHQWALRILQKTNYYLYVVFLIVNIVLGRWTSCHWVISGAVSILYGGGTLPYNLYN